MKRRSPREWTAQVHENRAVARGYSLLSLKLPLRFPRPMPGQFLMLSTGVSRETILRRPMAFFDFRKTGTSTMIRVLYAVVGKGTRNMTALFPGSRLQILAPIGNSFSTPRPGERVIVAAGGIGIAPFLLWWKELSLSQRKQVRVLFGFKDKSQLAVLAEFRAARMKPICAVEGPGGDFRGTVVDLLAGEFKREPVGRILTCGPERMMQAVVDFASPRRIPCEVSLEARMGCGLGVCLSCVTNFAHTDRPGGYALVCQDGPIFTV